MVRTRLRRRLDIEFVVELQQGGERKRRQRRRLTPARHDGDADARDGDSHGGRPRRGDADIGSHAAPHRIVMKVAREGARATEETRDALRVEHGQIAGDDFHPR